MFMTNRIAPLAAMSVMAVAAVYCQAAGTVNAESVQVAPSRDDLATKPSSDLAAPISSPRQLLGLFDISEAQLRSFRDGQPPHPDEDALLLKILFRLQKFPHSDVGRWQRRDVRWEQLAQAPDQYRAEIFHLGGRVRRVDKVRVSEELAKQSEFQDYYRVMFQLDGASHPVLICTRNVSEAWTSPTGGGLTMNERASAFGLFLKAGATGEAGRQLVFAARRVAWHPSRASKQLGTVPDHVLLGDLGMDVGLFDQVRSRNGKRMGPEGRECFYQLLAAVGRAGDGRLDRHDQATSPLGPLLNDAPAQHGKLVTLAGTARRAVKILVDDPDIRQRFGIDHYYEIEMFVPESVRVKRNKRDKEGRIFSTFPVVCCVRQLPPGMPEGDEIHDTVRVSGFFFKLWAYKTEFTSAMGDGRLQVSPLLVARRPQWIPAVTSSNPYGGLVFGCLFVVVLVGISLLMWRYSRDDRRLERATRAGRFKTSPGRSAGEADRLADGKPDFNGLK